MAILDRAVHPLDLTIRPGMFHLRQTVLDVIFVTDPIENVVEGIRVAGSIGELDVVVGQYRMDFIGNGLDLASKELNCDHFARLLMKFDIGKLAGPIIGDKQAQFALCRLHLGDINVKITERVALELRTLRLVAFGIGQTGDAVTLKAAMQRRARQVWDRRL